MKVAVVGATGLVGTQMIRVLEERDFPVTEFIPVASEKSVGKKITFKGKEYKVVGMQQAIDMKPNSPSFQQGVEPRKYGPRNLRRSEQSWWITPRPGGWNLASSW